MRSSCAHLYLHLVWSTWDRHPLIDEDVRGALYASMHAECVRHRADPIAIGGVEDHVHLLTRFSASVSISTLVKQVKGVSSHMMTSETKRGAAFRWQHGYGAFTLARNEVERIAHYVRNQAEHHRSGRLSAVLERTPSPSDLGRASQAMHPAHAISQRR